MNDQFWTWAGCALVRVSDRTVIMRQPPEGDDPALFLYARCTNADKRLTVTRVINQETLILRADSQ